MERDYKPQPLAAPFESGGGFVNNADSDVERNYWITDRGANVYELSPESVENPAVRHYIGLGIDAKELWGDIYMEAHKHRQANWLDGEESFHAFLDELETPSSSEFGASMGVRLHQAEQLMQAIERIMKDRVGSMGNINDSIAFHTEEAVKPLGLYLSRQPLTREKKAEIYQLLSSQQENVWQRNPDNSEEQHLTSSTVTRYGSFIERPYRLPSEKTSPEELARFAEVAEELDIPEKYWRNERVLGFVHVLIESRDLLAKFQEGERQPGAPGLVPPVAQRLQTSAEMMQAVISLLEAGFNEKKLDKAAIAKHLNNALTANYGIAVTETPQIAAHETDKENEAAIPWQQEIIAFTQQEPYTETVRAFPNEPLELLEGLYGKVEFKKDEEATKSILGKLRVGYVFSAFPFLPRLAQEKYAEQYYDYGYLKPTEDEEGFVFTDEEYRYLNILLETANIAELYNQKGEGEIPYIHDGEDEHYIMMHSALADMRKVATKLGLDWENTQDSSVSEA